MENIDEIIGRNLSMLRGDMSQEELAGRMRDAGYSWTKMTVYNIERGDRQLRLAEAVDVLRCLGRNPLSDIDKLLADDSTVHLLDLSSQLLDKNNVILAASADIGRLRIELANQYVLFAKNATDEEKQAYGDLFQRMVKDLLGLTTTKYLSAAAAQSSRLSVAEAVSRLADDNGVNSEEAMKTLKEHLDDLGDILSDGV